jgi:hypothetical protein
MRLTRSWYLEVARDSHTHQACARTTQTAHALVFGRVSLGGYICGIGHSRCACTWRVSAATSSSCTAPPHIWVQCSFDDFVPLASMAAKVDTPPTPLPARR